MGSKEKILVAALLLFNRSGTRPVTTNHIAKEAGVSPGNLYYHFANKQEIIREIFSQMSSLFDKITPSGSILPGSLEALDQAFRQITEAEWEYRFLQKEMVTLIEQDPLLKDLFLERQNARIVGIESCIRAMIELGLVCSLDEAMIGRLTQVIWLVAIFWNPYLMLKGEPVTRARISEGIELIRLVISPYLVAEKTAAIMSV